MFGGINVLMFLDLWQLTPVRDLSIAAHPCRGMALETSNARVMSLFWSDEKERVQGLYEFAVNKRSGNDAWFSQVIDECRQGHLHTDNYAFLHGFATTHCGSYMTKTKKLVCDNYDCHDLQQRVWPQMRSAGDSWKDACGLECDICAAERRRRTRLVSDAKEHLDAEYVTAPFITHMNKPRAAASYDRVLHYARHTQKQILWVLARDKPSTEVKRNGGGKQWQRWLRYHDQKTGACVRSNSQVIVQHVEGL